MLKSICIISIICCAIHMSSFNIHNLYKKLASAATGLSPIAPMQPFKPIKLENKPIVMQDNTNKPAVEPANNLNDTIAKSDISQKSWWPQYYKTITQNEGKGKPGMDWAPYKDTENIPTIGTGINLKAHKNWMINQVGNKTYNKMLSLDPNTRLDPAINESFVKYITQQNLNHLRNNYKNFDSLSDAQKIALLDMNYNLGPSKFNAETWPKTFNALRTGNYRTTAKEIMNSRAARTNSGLRARYLRNARAFDPRIK